MAQSATNAPGFGGFVSDSGIKTVSVYVPDPTADTVIGLYRFPCKGRIRAAYAVPNVTTAAHATNIYSLNLFNGGTAGTATTSVSGTTGGTAGWTAQTPQAISITSPALGTFTTGQWVQLNYDEGGTVAPSFTVVLDVDLFGTA